MAAAVIGALRVSLGLDSAQFDTGLRNAKGGLAGFAKAAAGITTALAAAGLGVFTAGVVAANGRIEEMRKLSAQLDRALTNTGNTAQTSASEVEAFADRLERSTGRAAEEIMAVSTNLATFGFGREQFFRAIDLANDMAAAWGGDLRQNMEGLARALADPEKGLAMLTKRGITFDDQQKKMIAGFMRVNDLAGAQGVIFGALEGQVKGVAEAGFGGITKALANANMAIEQFFEAVAVALGGGSGIQSALQVVTGLFDELTARISASAGEGGVLDGVMQGVTGAMNLVAKAVLLVFDNLHHLFDLFKIFIAAKIVLGVGAMGSAFINLWRVLRTTGITLAAVSGIMRGKLVLILLITAAIAKLTGTYETLAGWVEEAGRAIVKMLPAEIIDGIGSFANDLLGVSDELASVPTNLAGAVSSANTAAASFGSIGAAARSASDQIREGFAGAQEQLRDMVDTIQNGVATGLSSIVKAVVRGEDAVASLGDAVGRLGDQLIDMAMNQLIQGLFGSLFGAIGGGFSPQLGRGLTGASVFGGSTGFYGIPGLATGGRLTTSGLVEVGERGRELLHLPAGASVIRSSKTDGLMRPRDQSAIRVDLGPGLVATILKQAGEQSVQIVQSQAPLAVAQFSRNRMGG